MMYYIMPINNVPVDTTDMRKSLDGTRVVYHENLTNDPSIIPYTLDEIKIMMCGSEWSEPSPNYDDPQDESPFLTADERLDVLEPEVVDIKQTIEVIFG